MPVFLDGLPTTPVDWYDSAPLLAMPYNPDKVNELAVAVATPLAVDIDIYIQPTTNTYATLISFAVTAGTAQNTVDAIVAAMNAVCVDPTRNDPTEEQSEDAQLQARIDAMVADIGAVADPGGLHDQLLANAAWNALTADAQADVLRGVMRANGIDYHDIVLDLLRAVRYLLRQEKKRQTGVFSLTSKE